MPVPTPAPATPLWIAVRLTRAASSSWPHLRQAPASGFTSPDYPLQLANTNRGNGKSQIVPSGVHFWPTWSAARVGRWRYFCKRWRRSLLHGVQDAKLTGRKYRRNETLGFQVGSALVVRRGRCMQHAPADTGGSTPGGGKLVGSLNMDAIGPSRTL
jgi:hypothetical protein